MRTHNDGNLKGLLQSNNKWLGVYGLTLIEKSLDETFITHWMPIPALETAVGQGFVTNEGKYVDRIEACKIAVAAKQFKDPKIKECTLFSEDLFDW